MDSDSRKSWDERTAAACCVATNDFAIIERGDRRGSNRFI